VKGKTSKRAHRQKHTHTHTHNPTGQANAHSKLHQQSPASTSTGRVPPNETDCHHPSVPQNPQPQPSLVNSSNPIPWARVVLIPAVLDPAHQSVHPSILLCCCQQTTRRHQQATQRRPSLSEKFVRYPRGRAPLAGASKGTSSPSRTAANRHRCSRYSRRGPVQQTSTLQLHQTPADSSAGGVVNAITSHLQVQPPLRAPCQSCIR